MYGKKKRVGVTRRRATELVALLKDRIARVNSDSQYLYGVGRVALFGSYLTDKQKLGDIDVAIELGPKRREAPHAHWERCRKQSEVEGCTSSFLDRLNWPKEKTLRALRGRNYAFSFHPFDDLDGKLENGEVPIMELYRNELYRREQEGS